jgi:hypothetical protein
MFFAFATFTTEKQITEKWNEVEPSKLVATAHAVTPFL